MEWTDPDSNRPPLTLGKVRMLKTADKSHVFHMEPFSPGAEPAGSSIPRSGGLLPIRSAWSWQPVQGAPAPPGVPHKMPSPSAYPGTHEESPGPLGTRASVVCQAGFEPAILAGSRLAASSLVGPYNHDRKPAHPLPKNPGSPAFKTTAVGRIRARRLN